MKITKRICILPLLIIFFLTSCNHESVKIENPFTAVGPLRIGFERIIPTVSYYETSLDLAIEMPRSASVYDEDVSITVYYYDFISEYDREEYEKCTRILDYYLSFIHSDEELRLKEFDTKYLIDNDARKKFDETKNEYIFTKSDVFQIPISKFSSDTIKSNIFEIYFYGESETGSPGATYIEIRFEEKDGRIYFGTEEEFDSLNQN